MERLQKYLSEAGVASRRASEQLIAAGRVTVNGKPGQIGQSVEPGDVVEVDGKPVRPAEQHVYILFNKPKGIITTSQDTHGRKTVLDCLSGVTERVFPVGRLDLDVEGALLLTNDGELGFRLTHPRFEVQKVYVARVSGRMTPEEAKRLEAGVPLADGVTAPAKVMILKSDSRSTLVQLTLREGRKREVKRMCAAVGHPVRELRRVAFGNVRLGTLRSGEWRHLTEGELHALKEAVGLGAE